MNDQQLPSNGPDKMSVPDREFFSQVLDLAVRIESLANNISPSNRVELRDLIRKYVRVQLAPVEVRLFFLIKELDDAKLAARQRAYFDYWCEIT